MWSALAGEIQNPPTRDLSHFFLKGAQTTDFSSIYPTGINGFFSEMTLHFELLASYIVGMSIVNLDFKVLVYCFAKDNSSLLLKIEGT